MSSHPHEHEPSSAHPSDEGDAKLFRRYFTPQEANSTLVLVSRIVEDITQRFQRYLELRSLLEENSTKPGSAEKLPQAREELRSTTDELARLQEELTSIGCVLKDWQRGLVDFPARMHGRDVWLCWKLGEPQVCHWHEVNTGFADRQPIGDATASLA